MKIKPTGHWVLIEVTPVEEVSTGGIVLPSDQVKKEHAGRDIGRVVSFGPMAYKSFAGCEGPEDWGVAVGDTVEFRRYDGKMPRLAENDPSLENFRLIQDNDIIAVTAEEMQEAEGLIQQALGAEQEAEVEQEEEKPREYSAIEKEAMEMGGWLPKDEWIEANPDKDPEIWSPARDYVKYGKLQASIKDQKQAFDRKAHEFDERLENVNKLHKVQLEAQITAQRELMRTAASEADVEGFDAAQRQIEHLEGQREVQPAAPTKDPSIAAWEAKNSWIDDLEDPRALTAQSAFNNFTATNPQATIEQALSHVDKMVAKIAPPTNPRREAAPSTETTPGKPARKGRALTMNDLNPDERDMWKHIGESMFGGDEAKYLKACTDARKGA
jgi:co-chaperonin GroES (HSP10)